MRKTFPKLTALLLTLALALAMSAPALAVFGGGDLSLVKPGPQAVCYKGETVTITLNTDDYKTGYENQFECTLYPDGKTNEVWSKTGPKSDAATWSVKLKTGKLKPGDYVVSSGLASIDYDGGPYSSHYTVLTSALTVRKLKAPAKVSAKKSGKKVKLCWKKAKGATRYQIWRSKKKKSGFKKLAQVKGTKYTDKKAKKGHYYYRIQSIRAAGSGRAYSGVSKAARA